MKSTWNKIAKASFSYFFVYFTDVNMKITFILYEVKINDNVKEFLWLHMNGSLLEMFFSCDNIARNANEQSLVCWVNILTLQLLLMKPFILWTIVIKLVLYWIIVEMQDISMSQKKQKIIVDQIDSAHE